jgi:competence protein ComEC
MIALVSCFLAGILVVQQLTRLPELIWLPLVMIGLFMLAKFKYWRLFFFIGGMLWAILFATHRLNDRLPEQLAGQDIEIQGYVADLLETEENHVRFNFKVTSSKIKLPDLLRLTWYYPNKILKAGDQWDFTVRLKPPHGTFNPGGFDFERWLFVEGIGATGYVRSSPEPKLENSPPLTAGLLVWRQSIAGQLNALLASSESLSMIKALTIGDGNSLSPHQWEVFRKTGTTHLMVISGSHIGMIAGLMYLLILRLWATTGILAISPQKIAALSALAIAIFYAGLTGFSVPAQRSALMIAIAMFAIVLQRNTHPYHVLAVALFAVLLVDPLVTLSAGFWLSFIAVALIIYVLSGRLATTGFLKGSLTVNWVTSVGLAPILLFFFQQVSLISPIANLIVVPIISLIVVPLALLATLIMLFLPPVAEQLFIIVDFVLRGLWWILVQLAELPLSTLAHAQPSWWALVFAVPGLLLLFAPKGLPARSLGLVMLFPMIFTEINKIPAGTFKLTLLDVGQGLSTVVQTASHNLIFDTGAKFSGTSDAGQSVIVPFLRHEGINKIDTLIVSHGDNDHIGGVDSLAGAIPRERLLTSVPQRLQQYAPMKCKAGQSWTWDNVQFSILSPPLNPFLSDNDNSCVLHIHSGHGTAVLTGDIEETAEAWLIDSYGDKLKSDVLIAPHHGSKTSSTSAFLRTVNPAVILIPAGYRNQFGHPHQEVLQRYQKLNINWYNNSDNGAIQASFNEHLNIVSWRMAEGRYWNFTAQSGKIIDTSRHDWLTLFTR